MVAATAAMPTTATASVAAMEAPAPTAVETATAAVETATTAAMEATTTTLRNRRSRHQGQAQHRTDEVSFRHVALL